MIGKFGIPDSKDAKLIDNVSNHYFHLENGYLVGKYNKYQITGIYRNMTIEQVHSLPDNELPDHTGLIRIDYHLDNFYPVTIAYKSFVCFKA